MPILGIIASSVFITGSINFLKKLFITGNDGTLRSTTGALTTFDTNISSEVGTTWTTQNANFGNTLIRSVAYGNDLWIAGGFVGTLRTSTDAITWTTQTSNFGNASIFSVAYGNNLWIAGGVVGFIRTSTDGTTWTTQTSNFGNTQINSVAYGNNL